MQVVSITNTQEGGSQAIRRLCSVFLGDLLSGGFVFVT